MTESRIQGMKLVLEKTIRMMDAFLSEARELEIREKQVDRKRDLLSQRETQVLTDKAGVRDQTHDLDAKIKEFNSIKQKTEQGQQELRVQAGKIQKQKEELKEQQLELNEKISISVEIQERERELKIKEEEIDEKLSILASKQANIAKEVQIARDRKKILDEREKTLNLDKAKIQKYLNI